MGFLLTVFRMYLPRSIRRDKLNELFSATADAFQIQVPQLKGYSLDQCLTKYAIVTAENAKRAIQQGDECNTKERLDCNAQRIGQNIREELRIQTIEEVMQACEIVYRGLKIEFHGDPQGQINIRSCFFSSYYSSDICRIVSSLDEGLIAGLSGGLKLEFSQRITEGHSCCKARLINMGNIT